MSKPSLRERKKERTRARLIEVSQRLFAEQGYDATTLEQISDEAEVSVSTLLLYFESKERLALTPDYDTLADFRALVEDPDRRESTIDLWRAHVERTAPGPGESRQSYLRHYRFQASSPALVRGTLTMLQQSEDAVATGLARDFGVDPETDLATRLLATTLVFSEQTIVRRWIASGGTGDMTKESLAVIDFLVEHFPKPAATTSVRRAR